MTVDHGSSAARDIDITMTALYRQLDKDYSEADACFDLHAGFGQLTSRLSQSASQPERAALTVATVPAAKSDGQASLALKPLKWDEDNLDSALAGIPSNGKQSLQPAAAVMSALRPAQPPESFTENRLPGPPSVCLSEEKTNNPLSEEKTDDARCSG